MADVIVSKYYIDAINENVKALNDLRTKLWAQSMELDTVELLDLRWHLAEIDACATLLAEEVKMQNQKTKKSRLKFWK